MPKYSLEKLTRALFPWFWENDPNLAFLDTIVEGVFGNVNTLLGIKESETLAKIGYSIQRLSLENSLNTQFDATLSRITVAQGTVEGVGFVYNEAEVITTDKEMFVFNDAETVLYENEEFIYNQSEAFGSATGFIVNAPLDIASDEIQIIAWIDFVLIIGTDYTLIFS